MLETRKLCKSYGALTVTDAINLQIAAGELRAIIGPNGAGKTSLLTQLAGETRPDSGAIMLKGRDITTLPANQRCRLGIARTYQITSLLKSFSALDNVRIAAQGVDGHSFHFLKAMRKETELNRRAMQALDDVGLLAQRDTPADTLAYGEQRQLEIAMALVSQPRLLLLDEPTAGMGAEDSTRIADLIRSLKGKLTMILVEHDMNTVFSLADNISVLVQGRELICGAPEHIRGNADVRTHYLGEHHGHA